MSLDVSLYSDIARPRTAGSGIFVREAGGSREITREEWDAKYPGREPVTYQSGETLSNEVYTANITHNLNRMAAAAGLYEALWRPNEHGMTTAAQLIEPLSTGLARLQEAPSKFKAFDAPNGWGVYENLVSFVTQYLEACRENPDATVVVSV